MQNSTTPARLLPNVKYSSVNVGNVYLFKKLYLIFNQYIRSSTPCKAPQLIEKFSRRHLHRFLPYNLNRTHKCLLLKA